MDNILFAILLAITLFTAIIVPIILTKETIFQTTFLRTALATSGASFCTTPPNCGYTQDKYARHPCECEQFYQCIGSGPPALKTCSGGLYWDQSKKTCDWPDNVDTCQVEKPKDGLVSRETQQKSNFLSQI